MTTPDYILRFAEAIAPGNAELLLTGGTEEAILNAATDTISDLRKRIAELEAACEAALPIVCSRIEYPGDPCEKIADGIRAAIAKARGGGG